MSEPQFSPVPPLTAPAGTPSSESADTPPVVISWREAEAIAWVAVAMTPVIWWMQGPSVSSDQFVVRCGVLGIAVVAALGLRIRAILGGRRNSTSVDDPAGRAA